MQVDRATRPYSYLPEPFALVAVLVWIALLAAAWPNVTERGFLVRAAVYGVLASAAATHSWFIARRMVWSESPAAILISAAWLVVLGGTTAVLEWESAAPLVGVLAFLQLVECSFVTNHLTLRVTHAVSFGVMLLATARLSLAGGGVAWVAFAVCSMFLLAYDRTAGKAGPTGYNRGESRRLLQRIAAVSMVAVLSGLLFLLTPSLKWPDFAKQQARQSGGAGALPRLPAGDPLGVGGTTATPDPRSGPLAIMRVATEPAIGGPVYLRGRVFDTFDGESWSGSATDYAPIAVQPGVWAPLPFSTPTQPSSTTLVKQTVSLLVNMDGTIFTACRPTGVRFPDGNVDRVMVSVADRSLHVDGSIADQTRYEVNGFQDIFTDAEYASSDERRAAGVTDRDLSMPEGINRKVLDIAAAEASRATAPYDKAIAIERYLKRNYAYSLSHDVRGPQVVNDFMLRARRGHCALFASSMVVMARSVGLPARYVTGFVASERSQGAFLVRGSDAHAWVEVFVDGAGWIAFDPTSDRIDPADTRTRSLVRNGQPANADRGVAGQRGGGLYGRDPRTIDRGGANPRNDEPAGDDVASNGTDGGEGGSGPSTSGGGGAGGAGGGGGAGTVAGPDGGMGSADGPGDTGHASKGSSGGDIASSTPNGEAGGGDRGAGAAGSGVAPSGGSKPSQVIPPGGSTSLPQQGTGKGSTNTPDRPDSTRTPSVTKKTAPKQADAVKKPEPPDPQKVASDWRYLVAGLVGLGLVGLALLLFWNRGVRPIAERRMVREALPPDPPDETDPRRLVIRLYHQMVDGLARLGYGRRPSTTPQEYAADVGRRNESLAAPVTDLTDLFQNARYWDRAVPQRDADQAREAWERLARSVKRAEPGTSDEPAES